MLIFLVVPLALAEGSVTIEVLTDKPSYIPGEDIEVTINLLPTDSNVPPTFFDADMKIFSNGAGKFVNFNVPQSSYQDSNNWIYGAKGLANKFLDPAPSLTSAASGSYQAASVKYGWGLVGSSQKEMTLKDKQVLAKFKGKVLSGLVSGENEKALILDVNYNAKGGVVDYNEYDVPFSLKSITTKKANFKVVKSLPCSDDSACNGGFCVNNQCKDGADGSACLDNGDCKSGNYCFGFICKDGSQGDGCDSKDQCTSNICVANKCTTGTKGESCSDNNDCTNLICKADKTCGGGSGDSCAEPADCGTNICVSNKCGGNNDDTCTDKSQCKTGSKCLDIAGSKKCSDGSPSSGCTKDDECDEGNYCDVNNNQCKVKLPDDSKGCTKDSMCVSGECDVSQDPKVCKAVVDSDKDGIIDSKENQKCIKEVKSKNVFKSGAFIGCLKGDINLDNFVNSVDIIWFIEYFDDRDNYDPKNKPQPVDFDLKGDFNSNDIIGFIEAFDLR